MRILELPSWYIPQGGQFVQHQAKALQEQGVEVHILANVTLPWTVYKRDVLNVKRFPLRSFFVQEQGVETLRFYQRTLPRCPRWNIRLWAHRTLRLFTQYADKYGVPDLIHVHSGTWGAYAAAKIKKKWEVPYVVTEHRGMFGQKCQLAKNYFEPWMTEFLQEGYSNADGLIPVSEQLIPKMQTFLTREVPFHVIGNIVDTDFFSPVVRTNRPTDSMPFRFVSVNGYYAVKGYDILLRAWDQLCDQVPNCELRIVGENFEQEEFQHLLMQCRHRDRISFAGEIGKEGVREELSKANTFVLSSRVEAAPVAVLEALSMGLPVVGTEVVPEYVLSKEQGIRVPVEDTGALAEAMEQIMKDVALYNAETQHAHAVNIAYKENIAKQLIEVYKEVLDRAAKI
ncbi:MAG: glycosyltransferase family 4 protein [Paludibacteraceae bacterium]|nr:glycosyltransferase family 4 protein [Paludibacteraceae bacterium]